MLLDSQSVWWALTDAKRLGKALRQKLDRNHIAYYSVVSVFEFFQKSRNGKLRVPENLVQLLQESGLHEIQFHSNHAMESRFISPEIVDPFDRMLIAQAQWGEIDFYTSDRTILALGLEFVKDVSI